MNDICIIYVIYVLYMCWIFFFNSFGGVYSHLLTFWILTKAFLRVPKTPPDTPYDFLKLLSVQNIKLY